MCGHVAMGQWLMLAIVGRIGLPLAPFLFSQLFPVGLRQLHLVQKAYLVRAGLVAVTGLLERFPEIGGIRIHYGRLQGSGE